MPTKLQCCFPGCNKEPDFGILSEGQSSDMETHACSEHVGELLEPGISRVYPIGHSTSSNFGKDAKILETKKTIKAWEKELGVTILDPDGFDHTDPKLYKKEFTKEEFLQGIYLSTTKSTPEFFSTYVLRESD